MTGAPETMLCCVQQALNSSRAGNGELEGGRMAGMAVVCGRRACGVSLECALHFVAGGVAADEFEIINGDDGTNGLAIVRYVVRGKGEGRQTDQRHDGRSAAIGRVGTGVVAAAGESMGGGVEREWSRYGKVCGWDARDSLQESFQVGGRDVVVGAVQEPRAQCAMAVCACSLRLLRSSGLRDMMARVGLLSRVVMRRAVAAQRSTTSATAARQLRRRMRWVREEGEGVL